MKLIEYLFDCLLRRRGREGLLNIEMMDKNLIEDSERVDDGGCDIKLVLSLDDWNEMMEESRIK